MLTSIGLYYKLHGVHRPVAMKKSVIKRRKRVVPAPQGTQASGFDINSHTGSPESDSPLPGNPHHDQRGTVNADGSINLGFRPRYEPRLLPAPVAASQVDSKQQLPSIGPASHGSNQSNHHQDNSSLNNDNRLPPMTSYPSPTPRPPSLSPNSFLSPSRKRSFTVAENEPATSTSSESNSKRLSSIKSILNPSQQLGENSEALDPSLRFAHSLEMHYGKTPSPSSYGHNSAGAWESSSAQSSGRDAESESERAKMERRAELQREAERMREALRAKERELAELNE
jgi:GATA-binding protein, other eukaryote